MVPDKSKENLKKARKLSTDEARKIGRKGGKKSAEVRQRRKTIKEDLLAILETKQPNGKTIQENWMTALARNLLKGDVRTATFVRDTIGEKPKEMLEVESNDLSAIKIKFVDKSERTGSKEKDPKIVGDYTPPTNTEQ